MPKTLLCFDRPVQDVVASTSRRMYGNDGGHASGKGHGSGGNIHGGTGDEERDGGEGIPGSSLGEQRMRLLVDERRNRVRSDDRVREVTHSLLSLTTAIRAEPFATPRLVCIFPPFDFEFAEGLFPIEQNPLNWIRQLEQWREENFKTGKGLFTKRKRLFIVCAHML